MTIFSKNSFPSQTRKYRPDIDGLRAIAVIPVVLFHAGLKRVSGGFVGVDVFFVISGFLITSIIAGEIYQKQFSIVRFYERRIRRIFPALFAIIALSFFAAFLLFMPLDFRRFGESVVAMTLFGSNFLFWHQAGYFDADANLKPMLHTWSLAVEEQFYLFFPIFLVLIFNVFKRIPIAVIVACLVASLFWSIWDLQVNPMGAFYLPAARAWELLIGALLAIYAPRQFESRSLNEILGLLGLSLILLSIFLYSPTTSFPGAAALIPCVGAALILYSGGCQATLVGKFLSMRPVVFFGLISYSLYLLHWPLLVFTRYIVGHELSAVEITLILLASVALATLSWRCVELPFRRRGTLIDRRVVFVGSGGAMLILLTGGVIAYQSNGLPQRLPADVAKVAMGAFDTKLGKSECDLKSAAEIQSNRICEIGFLGAHEATFAVLGDSFAIAVLPAIQATAIEAHKKGAVLTRGGCYPLVGIYRGDRSCENFLTASLNFINAHAEIKQVILIGRWTSAAEGSRFGATIPPDLFITDEFSLEANYAENKRVFVRAFQRTIEAIGPRKVFVVMSLPEQKIDVPRTAALNLYLGRKEAVGLSRIEFDKRQSFTRDALLGLAGRLHFELLDASSLLCTASVCHATKDGFSLYSDDNHLNRYGARQIESLFNSVFEPG